MWEDSLKERVLLLLGETWCGITFEYACCECGSGNTIITKHSRLMSNVFPVFISFIPRIIANYSTTLNNKMHIIVPYMYTHNIYKKVKWSRYRPGVAKRVGRSIALLFHDRGTRRGWVVSSTPRPRFNPGKDPVPIYRRLGGPQGRSGRAENLVPPGIRFRTVQPIAQSLYRLSYPAHLWQSYLLKGVNEFIPVLPIFIDRFGQN